METELFHADGQTDMKELIVAFRSFAKTPKSNNLILLTEIQAVVFFSKNYMKHINTCIILRFSQRLFNALRSRADMDAVKKEQTSASVGNRTSIPLSSSP